MKKEKIIEKLNSSVSFNQDEKEVISEYVGSSYELFSLAAMFEAEQQEKSLINKRCLLERILRLPVDDFKYIPKSILEIYKSLMDKSAIPCPLVVYRGTSKKHFYATNIFNNDPNNYRIAVGTTYKSIVCQSSSLELETAFDFTSKRDPLIIEYQLHKRFPGLWVEQESGQKESEIVLNRNQLYEITRIGRIDIKGNITDSPDYNYIRVKSIQKYN